MEVSLELLILILKPFPHAITTNALRPCFRLSFMPFKHGHLDFALLSLLAFVLLAGRIRETCGVLDGPTNWTRLILASVFARPSETK